MTPPGTGNKLQARSPTRASATQIVPRIALVLLVLITAAALFAPWIAPQNPYDLAQLDIMDARLAPGSASSAPAADGGTRHYLLGSDDQGRDMLSAILYGLRTSLMVALASTVLALSLGLLVGLVSAWRGGWFDALAMRIADLQLSFPSVLIALVLLAVMGQGVDKIIAALIAVQWAYYARTVRGVALAERNREYIRSAIALGLPAPRIILVHLLPNCLPPLLVVAMVQIAAAISLEATLSFLGLGLPITEPSLGLLIANGFTYMLSGKYWISFYPGLALLLTIACINLVGDRWRDTLDPRLGKAT